MAVDVLTCAEDALLDFSAYLDRAIEVLKQGRQARVEDDTLIDWTSSAEEGLFAIGVDADGSGGPERDLSGEVTPKERCLGGMEKDDICILKWTVNMRTSSQKRSHTSHQRSRFLCLSSWKCELSPSTIIDLIRMIPTRPTSR